MPWNEDATYYNTASFNMVSSHRVLVFHLMEQALSELQRMSTWLVLLPWIGGCVLWCSACVLGLTDTITVIRLAVDLTTWETIKNKNNKIKFKNALVKTTLKFSEERHLKIFYVFTRSKNMNLINKSVSHNTMVCRRNNPTCMSCQPYKRHLLINQFSSHISFLLNLFDISSSQLFFPPF